MTRLPEEDNRLQRIVCLIIVVLAVWNFRNTKLLNDGVNISADTAIALPSSDGEFAVVISYNLYDLQRLDISNLIGPNENRQLEIYSRDDGSFYILRIDEGFILRAVHIKRNKQVISKHNSRQCVGFTRKKYGIFVLSFWSFWFTGPYLGVVDYDLRHLTGLSSDVLDYINEFRFLAESDSNYYLVTGSKIYIYTRNLDFMESFALEETPTERFYFPKSMMQLEVMHNKYYMLTNTHLRIMNKSNGYLIRSIEVAADKFVIDSRDNIVLLNKRLHELNCFNKDGYLVSRSAVQNYRDGVVLMTLDRDDMPVFYDTKAGKLLYLR